MSYELSSRLCQLRMTTFWQSVEDVPFMIVCWCKGAAGKEPVQFMALY